MGVRTPESAQVADNQAIGTWRQATHARVFRLMGKTLGFGAEAAGYAGGAVVRSTVRFVRGGIRGTFGM